MYKRLGSLLLALCMVLGPITNVVHAVPEEAKEQVLELVTPENRVVVNNDTYLTEDEKMKVLVEVVKANLDLPEDADIQVDEKGNIKVTLANGSVGQLDGDKLVLQKDKFIVNPPKNKVEVKDLRQLTEDEKLKVILEIIKANPDLPEDTDIYVDDHGEVHLYKNDDTFAHLKATQTVEKEKVIQTAIMVPEKKVAVEDQNKLTDDEKQVVVNAIRSINAFEEGVEVVVDDKGNATVTLSEDNIVFIEAEKLVVEKDQETLFVVNPPKDKVEVKDKENLTEDEKLKVLVEVVKANLDLSEDADIQVDDKGNVTVTRSDGKTATLTAEQTLQVSVEETEETKVKLPEEKVEVEDVEALTDEEKDEIRKT